MAEFVCNLCLFEEPRELSEADHADREVLTVINGQMVLLVTPSPPFVNTLGDG